MKRNVILITDGDSVARQAIEVASAKVKARVISMSAGNPTPLRGDELILLIREAKHDPVLVMFDDNGNCREGDGESALRYVATHPDIRVIGALAVASHTPYVSGIQVDFSIDANGQITPNSVDKDGLPVPEYVVKGDTVDVLREIKCPLIVGIGDPGKMKGKDSPYFGAPITTRALQEIIYRCGISFQAANTVEI